MRARPAALVASLLLAGCATGPGGPGTRDYYERRILRANPGKVIATELAFARAAQEDGQWTAFVEFAADGAVMFVPQPVKAKDWLKQQVNPPQAVTWQPHQVWSSCDGTLAVTKGAWQRPDGSVGYFTTVWERQRDGEYKWTMDQGDTLEQPLEAPQMIEAQVADCSEVMAVVADPLDNPSTGNRAFSGASRDESLEWSVMVEADQSRVLMIDLWKDGDKQRIMRSEVAAPSVE